MYSSGSGVSNRQEPQVRVQAAANMMILIDDIKREAGRGALHVNRDDKCSTAHCSNRQAANAVRHGSAVDVVESGHSACNIATWAFGGGWESHRLG